MTPEKLDELEREVALHTANGHSCNDTRSDCLTMMEWLWDERADLIAAARREAALREALDAAYAERNLAAQLAAVLAIDGGWRAGFGVDESEPDWPVLYIDLGSYGQVSWHMPQAERMAELPVFEGQWDGTDDKLRIVTEFARALRSEVPQ